MSTSSFSLAYCNNIWIHHQSPVCTEFVRILGEEKFKMCLFEQVTEEQRKLGYSSTVPAHQWIAGPPSSPGDMDRLRKIVCDADVAVLGSGPQEIKAARIATGKLSFFMSERLMRRRFYYLRMLNPRFAMGIRRFRRTVNCPNVHYLAIGGHAVADAKLLKVFDNRIWNWAYFISQATKPFCERPASSVRILWAGRFLSLKRVDMILRAMVMLGSTVHHCTLELIGEGPTSDAIARLAKRLGLSDRVNFLGSMSHEAVRARMSEADVYVFPSNRLEGWGAVVGEAMCEGCVVVASKAAGASTILIEHGRTGFLFNENNVSELADILKQIVVNSDLRRQVGQAAAAHMQRLWHPSVGAERLVKLSKGLLGLGPMPEYKDGPCCSLAKR